MKCDLLIVLVLLSCFVSVKMQFNTTDLDTRVEILENDVANLEDKVVNIEDDVDDVEEDVNQNLDQILENNNNIFDISSTVDDLDGTLAQLVDRMSSLEQDMAKLQEINNNQSITIGQQQSAIDSLDSTIDSLDSTIDSLNSTIDSQGSIISVLENTIQVLENTDNTTCVQLEILKEDVRDLNSEVSTHDQDILALTNEMFILEETVDDVEETMAALQVVNNDILDRLTKVEELVIVPWTACTSSPCSNGGTCVDVNVGAFICMCRDGFFGVNCEQDYSDMSFLATISAPAVTPTDPMVFDDARLNPGGHYDPGSGIYTVPLDGIYQFVLHYRNYEDKSSGAFLKVDDVRVAHISAADADYEYQTADLVIVHSLTAGQKVWISPDDMGGMFGTDTDGHMYAWFSGHLIYAL